MPSRPSGSGRRAHIHGYREVKRVTHGSEEPETLLAPYATGFHQVASAVEGASEADLDRHGPTGWSARQVVHHLADSETMAATRVRRLVADDDPVIQGMTNRSGRSGSTTTGRSRHRSRSSGRSVLRVTSCRPTSRRPSGIASGPTRRAVRTRSNAGSRSTPITATNTPTRSAGRAAARTDPATVSTPGSPRRPVRPGRPGFAHSQITGFLAEEEFGFNAELYARTGKFVKILGL